MNQKPICPTCNRSERGSAEALLLAVIIAVLGVATIAYVVAPIIASLFDGLAKIP